MKKILVALLAIAAACTMSFTAFAADGDEIEAEAEIIAEEAEEVEQAELEEDPAIDLTQPVTGTVTVNSTIAITADTTITGGGTFVRGEDMTTAMFSVASGVTLTLENITIDGGAVWAYAGEPTEIETVLERGTTNEGIVSGAVIIDNSGTVVVGEGAVLQNNDATVINANSGASVTIAGGTICNNGGSAVNAPNANNILKMTDGEVYGNYSEGGGLTYIKGIATIDGGKLHNNYAGIGGIFRLVSGSTVTINGGKFYNNSATNGGVAYVYCWSGSSKLIINGGELYNNTATEGGVGFTSGKNCSITINDGNIHHNSAYTGGAFKLDDYAYFAMNGGVIANNSAETLGGALRQWGSWGTSFNGGTVKDNTAKDGEAIWMGNGLFLSGTKFENNDIYTADYIRVDEDFQSFELSDEQTADVRGNNGYVLTQADLAKVTVNGLCKFPYYDEASKHIIFVDEYVTVIKDGEQIQVKTLEEAIEVVDDDGTIVVFSDISDKNITINKNIEIVTANAYNASILAESEDVTLENVVFTVESDKKFSLDGFEITGLSYIFAKTPESISVTNCEINVTTIEVAGTNCPPGFILFSSNNNGSVELTFTNNTLLAAPDATEDWYTYNHGIAGWNSIEKATIKNNVFGSEDAPLGAGAIKLMNFVDGATVEVSGNTFYVESKDSTWGPNAIQFYQNNSRANNYTVTISDNDFYVDSATAAVGVNTNAMGKPVEYAGGATVEIAADNTVNDNPIAITDVIVFGNGINDEACTRGYVGVGVEKDNDGKIIGGWFNNNSLGLASALADGYTTVADFSGYLMVADEKLIVESINVVFEEVATVEGELLYNINLVATNSDIINRLNSADLTFVLTQINGTNDFEIIASNSEIAINPVDNSKVRYEFHYKNKDGVTTDTANKITIGQVKFSGYGKFDFAVDAQATTNAAHATTFVDNIVDTFIPDGDTTVISDGELVIDDAIIEDAVIVTPTRKLVINIDFPNSVTNNEIGYQAMQVKITGEDLEQPLVIDLGTNSTFSALDVYKNKDDAAVTFGTDVYEITIENLLTVNTSYTVEVSGAGYRTARYTVTMNCDEYKTLNFWNNVKDNVIEVEEGKASSATDVTFLAGDIVKDSIINIYDLSAVVSYFGEIDLNDGGDYNAYAKYDLNRDGKIDSKDVAYVLVSWGK